MEAEARQLFCLKSLLNTYADWIGLKVNYKKSQMISINLYDSKATYLYRIFGCQFGTMPFTYLEYLLLILV